MARKNKSFSGSEKPSEKAFSKFTIRLDDVSLSGEALKEVRNQAVKAAIDQAKKAGGLAGAQGFGDFGTFSTFSTFSSAA